MQVNYSAPAPGYNKSYIPSYAQSFTVPYDKNLHMFNSGPVTRTTDGMKLDYNCDNLSGLRMQFDIHQKIGFDIHSTNLSICLQTYGDGLWLGKNSVYITDVLGTANYTWPNMY